MTDELKPSRATDAEIATLTARVADWKRWHNRLGEIVGVPGGGVTLEAIATLTAERDRYRTEAETYNQQAADTIRGLTAENARVLGLYTRSAELNLSLDAELQAARAALAAAETERDKWKAEAERWKKDAGAAYCEGLDRGLIDGALLSDEEASDE